jgi:transposase
LRRSLEANERQIDLELPQGWLCRACGCGFRQQFPGILKWQRASELFRRMIFFRHWDGINRRRLGQREGLASATIERWFQHVLKKLAAERSNPLCPAVLGIDEHFFSRKHGYATTLCDLRRHRVYDVVLGRSEASLESYFHSLEGKGLVCVVCMDLASMYRAIVRKHGDSGGNMPVSEAVAMIRATAPQQRSEFAKEIWNRRRRRGTDRSVPF